MSKWNKSQLYINPQKIIWAKKILNAPRTKKTHSYSPISCQNFIIFWLIEKSEIISCIKGTCSQLVKFVYNFFLPQTLYISSMKPSFNRTTIFKLIVQEIKLRAIFQGRENKQKQDKSSNTEQKNA